ncbi:hypothetical protein L596_021918 [Steinernema carpocapsae]|uniref:Uncharacterized protein n=1 Tax=Steinernema carpocapsae TaxID=34508 RepID=A0A4U5ML06_STECR|nr:hypothetical protein L596_021918 [Steinernema carpocapsae]
MLATPPFSASLDSTINADDQNDEKVTLLREYFKLRLMTTATMKAKGTKFIMNKFDLRIAVLNYNKNRE